ncbi:mitochondrial protein Pet127-domain-containing protein [Cubamyces menziesii]|nr:mitochondrial protein Pet127-domain-containing protein [Cubamyces menziesii]
MQPRVGKQTVVVSQGTLLDRSFRPLKDVQKARKKHIPQLAHGLNEVLRREGVHWLRDPETQKYNFPEYLENIPRVEDFAFDRLPGFTPSSRDMGFVASVKQAGCRFAGSTSSLTGILTQIYLLLSEEKSINISDLSAEFDKAPRFFTPGQRIPTSVILLYQNGIYTTDYDGERDSSDPEEIILLPLGTLLEKFLTLPKAQFDTFLKSNTSGQHPKLTDVHRYAKYGNFLMRSQLDCYDKSLPGTGVFDLKTRAISAIRHDVYNYLNYIDHNIESLRGREGSFESEYYDMIRSAFLEYSFQARIGNMDGVLVAYHNTARIFGFQYISLREMDRCLFGREDAGDRVFLRCVALMEILYEHITNCFPRQSVKVTFEKRSTVVRAWVEPLEVDGGEPPVVELQLHLQNIMHGRAAKGSYVIYADYPWTVQYRIERNVEDQATILRNRDRAYKRQMSIAKSLPTTQEGSEGDAEVLEETFGVSDPAQSQSTVLVDEGTV